LPISVSSRHAPTSVSRGYASISTRQALVVGQVEVQRVQPVQREYVDDLEDELLRHEVPGDVQHHPAPGELRRVHDPHGRDRDLAVRGRLGGLDQLRVRRLRVPERILGAGRQPGTVRGHVDAVLGRTQVLDHVPDGFTGGIRGEPRTLVDGEFTRGRDDRDVRHPDSFHEDRSTSEPYPSGR
jgi:hypothetical protein